MKFSKITLVAALALTTALTSCGPKDADIQSALQAKETTGVTVAVKDGTATLSGEVADDAAKMNAEKIAHDEKGVKNVTNSLTIMAPPPAPVMTAPVVISADSTLSAAVRDAVKDHPTVMASVKDGVVTLTGSIKKADLPGVMMTLQSLKPKKVESAQLIKN